MVSYRLIGTATTNTHGVASTTYTGTSAGKVDIIASTSPMGLIFQHIGTDYVTDTDEFIFESSAVDETVSSTGTLVENTSNTNQNYWANLTDSSIYEAHDWHYPLTIEFEILESTGNCYFIIRDENDVELNDSFAFLGVQGGGAVSVRITSNSIIYYVNGEHKHTVSDTTLGNAYIKFLLSPNASFEYKNFIITGNHAGNLVSDSYELFDCTKYDIGTSANNTMIWTPSTNNGVTRLTDYSVLGGSNNIYTTISGDVCIEFDVKGEDLTNNFVSVRNGSTGLLPVNLSQLGLNVDQWYHIKVQIIDNVCTISNTNNSNFQSRSVTGYNRLYLSSGANADVSFKNFIVYPI